MQKGDIIQMTASEVMNLAREIANTMYERPVSLKEACMMYSQSEQTIKKRIRMGDIAGHKVGGVWEVETPKTRAKRTQTI